MLTCRICGCNCDPGDLENGICDECREEEEIKDKRSREIGKMISSEFKQIRLEDILR